jgi:hypothetical protein
MPKDKLYITNGRGYIVKSETPDLIPKRLAHINPEYIEKTIETTYGLSISKTAGFSIYEPCLKAKMHRHKG